MTLSHLLSRTSSPLVHVGVLALLAILSSSVMRAQVTSPQTAIFDTDIGDDIDDVLALGLLLQSPEIRLAGITTAWGDTGLRANMVDRFLAQTHHTDIPVLQGVERHKPGEAKFSQAAWARRAEAHPHADAVEFILRTIKEHPGEVTLISVAPLTNLGAAIDRDPEVFHKLKRIVIMGGSVRRGHYELGVQPYSKPAVEYNIAMDVPAAKKVFAAGVPLYVMPLDSTQIKLDEAKRQVLFTRSTDLTDVLALLYAQWSRETRQQTPIMFDAVAAAFAVNPEVCPVTPLRLTVEDNGLTREDVGKANAFVCLTSDSDRFFEFYLPRLLGAPSR